MEPVAELDLCKEAACLVDKVSAERQLHFRERLGTVAILD